MDERLTLAGRFARSLDDEDYETTAALLAPDCRYRTGDELHEGVDAILGSYRAHAERARSLLDGIRYESSVRAGPDGGVIVEFVDHCEHRAMAHTYRCEQHLVFDTVAIDRDGARELRIARIRHVELTGEREALTRWFGEVGIA